MVDKPSEHRPSLVIARHRQIIANLAACASDVQTSGFNYTNQLTPLMTLQRSAQAA